MYCSLEQSGELLLGLGLALREKLEAEEGFILRFNGIGVKVFI